MSGSHYVFDTNAIVALLQGNAQLILQQAGWIGVSIISSLVKNLFICSNTG
jgi:tRNA(fMet)-specific endonuclease VapC